MTWMSGCSTVTLVARLQCCGSRSSQTVPSNHFEEVVNRHLEHVGLDAKVGVLGAVDLAQWTCCDCGHRMTFSKGCEIAGLRSHQYRATITIDYGPGFISHSFCYIIAT